MKSGEDIQLEGWDAALERRTAGRERPTAALANRLTLVAGPPNSGKLGQVIGWWQENREAAPFLLAPTRMDARGLAAETLERSGGVVIGGAPSGTFDDLGGLILGGRPRLLGPLRRQVLLRRILSTADLEPLSAMAELPGAGQAFEKLLRELGETGMPLEGVTGSLDAWAQASGDSLPEQLALAYEKYAAACATLQVQERWEVMARAERELGSAEWRRPVAAHGFTTFTSGQRSLLLALSQRVPVLVTLIAGAPAFDEAWGGEVGWWQERATEVVYTRPQTRVYSSAALTRLNAWWGGEDRSDEPAAAGGAEGPAEEPGAAEQAAAESGTAGDGEGAAGEGLSGDSKDTQGPKGATGVRFMLSSGRRNEVELAGRQIVGLLRDGVPPSEIAVVVRDSSRWHRIVGQVFHAYGIPHRIDMRMEFGATGLGAAFLQAVRGFIRGDFAELFAYLRGPYSPYEADLVDRLEIEIHEGALHSGAGLRRAVARSLPDQLTPLRNVLGKDGSGRAVIRPEGVEDLSRAFLERASLSVKDIREMEADARAFGVVRGWAEELSHWQPAFSGEQPPTAAEALSALSKNLLPMGREEEGGVVHVLTAVRARARRFTVMFMLGLVEGEFPRPREEKGFLSRRRRQEANRVCGRELFVDRGPNEEEALFALLLSRPWQLLYLSARDTEDEGEEVVPSPFYETCRTVLGADACNLRRGLEEVVHPVGEAPSEREYLRACAVQGLVPDAAWSGRLETVPWRRPPRLTRPEVLGQLAGQDSFAARQLESYAQCPFRWFIEDLIGREKMKREMDPLARGIVLHGALSAIYGALAKEALLPLGPAGLKRAFELVEFHVAQALSAFEHHGTAAQRRLLLTAATRDLKRFCEFDANSGSELRPAFFEHSVGVNGGVDIGGVKVRGRIDRIDVDAQGRNFVIDYKGGNSVPKLPFSQEGNLQIPLYLCALRAEGPQTQVAGGAYAALGSNKRAGIYLLGVEVGGWARKPLNEEELLEELELCVARAGEAAEGMRSGRIASDPADGNCLFYCDLAGICRSDRRPERF